MEYIRIEYKDRTKEVKEFKTKEEMGMWVAENLVDVKDVRYEDMAMKIRFNTKDGKEITKKAYADLTVFENIAKIADEIELVEERIRTINIITPTVGVYRNGR